ncbi:leucine ABC transporter subunit substrate-binding protein LivK [Variovorax sp. PBS-H4]|uniref:ABC transporter substrate-binding protein n=1 Tax=Variovorax sp. PBS-H4 TaxID=434008 RepID=UPI00131799F4|nr:ABC transporter substrate-binding protein [Variovorax sp. PBS-H4]VTU27437.1 leucine ABC transporter subunit substrate-binding protein LivK [Variovorax sp. PBS-H4]
MIASRPRLRWASLLAAALALTSTYAADLKVGVSSSLSGPLSALGIPYEKGVRAAYALHPEIGGRKVQLIVLDDASDPTTAARNARKLISEDKVDVLIGTSGVPGSLAMASVAREMQAPLISPTPFNLPAADSSWTVTVSQAFPVMVNAVVERMKKSGVKTVGFIGYADALGDLAYDSLVKSADAAGIKVVSNERYGRTDASVAGQVLKILAARPDAVFAGNSGSPGALPYLALKDRGYRGSIYGTHGLINVDFVRVASAAADGLMVPSGPVMVADELPAGNAAREPALAFRSVYRRLHGTLPEDAFSAYTFDAWLLFADAAARVDRKMEPGTPQFRAALRDAIVSTKSLAGANGTYNFRPGQPYGLEQPSVVVIRLEKGAWRLVP